MGLVLSRIGESIDYIVTGVPPLLRPDLLRPDLNSQAQARAQSHAPSPGAEPALQPRSPGTPPPTQPAPQPAPPPATAPAAPPQQLAPTPVPAPAPEMSDKATVTVADAATTPASPPPARPNRAPPPPPSSEPPMSPAPSAPYGAAAAAGKEAGRDDDRDKEKGGFLGGLNSLLRGKAEEEEAEEDGGMGNGGDDDKEKGGFLGGMNSLLRRKGGDEEEADDKSKASDKSARDVFGMGVFSARASDPVRGHLRNDSEDLAEVDLVMKFDHLNIEDYHGNPRKQESLRELRKKRQGIFKAVRYSGLTSSFRQSTQVDDKGRPVSYYLLITVNDETAAEEAERVSVSKLLKEEYRDVESSFPGYARYQVRFHERFQPASYGSTYFTSLQRQRIIFSKLEARLSNKGAGLDLDGLKEDGIVDDFTFMPCVPELDTLYSNWVMAYLKDAPVHDVCAYLGEKIGFYFAFYDTYLWALRPLCIFSLAVVIFQLVLTAETGRWASDNLLVPFYAIIISLWSTLFLEIWKRREATLGFLWDVHTSLEDEPVRPEYLRNSLTEPRRGVYKPGIGFVAFPWSTYEEEVMVFPYGEHMRRIIISFSIMFVLICAVATGALLTLAYRVVLRETEPEWGNYLGSGINVVFIAITDYLWTFIALRLNDWEMYRTDSQWYNALIYKTFTFRFINKNATPFYIAFVQGQQLELFGLGRTDRCPNNDCLLALSEYLLVAIVFSEISRNLLTLLPLAKDWLVAWWKARGEQLEAARVALAGGDDADEEAAPAAVNPEHELDPNDKLALVEGELAKSDYPGTFYEMLELSIQFGYVTMFAVAFPAAPLVVQINNLIERKTDALKTLKLRKPRVMNATGIGSWRYVLEFLAVISVVTNMLIMFFSSAIVNDELGQRANLDLSEVLLLVFIAEHLILTVKVGVSLAVPDIPRWVQRAKTRSKLRDDGETEKSLRLKNDELQRQLEWEEDIDEGGMDDHLRA